MEWQNQGAGPIVARFCQAFVGITRRADARGGYDARNAGAVSYRNGRRGKNQAPTNRSGSETTPLTVSRKLIDKGGEGSLGVTIEAHRWLGLRGGGAHRRTGRARRSS